MRKCYRDMGYEKGDETKSEVVNSKYDNWVVGHEGGGYDM